VAHPVSRDDAVQDALRARLTPAEWAWVHHGVALAPVFALAIVLLGLVAEATASALPSLALAWVAVAGIVLLVGTLDGRARRARRTQAVLTRPLREGRHVWAVPDGDRVRVYRVAEERRLVPHVWPLALGHRARVVEGREFHAEREAEEAHRFADEAERAALAGPGARGLVRVLNDPR